MIELKLPSEKLLATITFTFPPVAFFYLYFRSYNQIFLISLPISLILYAIQLVIVRYFGGVAKKKGYEEFRDEHKMAEDIIFDGPSLIIIIISIGLFLFSMISLLQFIGEIGGILLFSIGFAGILYVLSFAFWGKNKNKTFRLLKKFRKIKYY